MNNSIIPKEFKHKNDYSCIFFFDNREPLKWNFVHDVRKACLDVPDYVNGIYFSYVNVYARRSKRFLKRFYYNDSIESFPK